MILVASVSIWGSIIPLQTVAGSVLLERDFFRHPPTDCKRCGEGNYASYTDCYEIVPSCPASPPYAWPLPQISASCQIMRAIDQLYCATDPPYIAESEINCDNPIWKNGPKTQLFCEKKIIAERSVSRVMSLPSLISLFASPLFGYGVDHVGNRAVIAIGASFLVALSQVGIAFSSMSIWVLLFVQGVSSCLYFAAIWPSIPCTFGNMCGICRWHALKMVEIGSTMLLMCADFRRCGRRTPRGERVRRNHRSWGTMSCYENQSLNFKAARTHFVY